MLAHRMDHRGDVRDPDALWFGCAPVGQHEMGIAGLRLHLRCDPEAAPGIARRRIAGDLNSPVQAYREDTPRSETFYVEEPNPHKPGSIRVRRTHATTSWTMLDLAYHARPLDHLPRIGRDIPRFAEDQPFAGAWDSDTLTLLAFGDAQPAITSLQTAFAETDVAIWVSRHDDGLFPKAGLVLARPSRLKPEILRHLEERDRDRDALLAADQATGMRERIAARGYPTPWGVVPPSLDARWRAESVPSAHPVVYWLHTPGETNSTGWYTVEDLERWIDHQIDRPPEPIPYPARRRPTA